MVPQNLISHTAFIQLNFALKCHAAHYEILFLYPIKILNECTHIYKYNFALKCLAGKFKILSLHPIKILNVHTQISTHPLHKQTA